MQRVMGVILDASEWADIERLIAEGAMPTLARLRQRGLFCQLRTWPAYTAESPCTEFLTGRSPSTTRYWSTVQFDPATYRSVTVGSAVMEPFYGLGPAFTVVAFDVPHSVISARTNGVQVVSWGGHDARYQYASASRPSDLMAEIYSRFGRHPADVVEFTGYWHEGDYINRLADALVAGVARRTEIALWLQERQPAWDLFLMAMSEPHSAGHNFAHGLAAPGHVLAGHETAPLARRRFADLYRAIDQALARLEAHLPSGAVLAVMSVKGMQPNHDDIANSLLFPELLYRRAFGRAFLESPPIDAWRAAGYPLVHGQPTLPWSQRPPGERIRHLAPAWMRRGVRAIRARRAAAAPATGPIRGRMDWHPASWYRHRWQRMPAFAVPTHSETHVRVNLQGRERHGIVPLKDYAAYCDSLESVLRQATDPRSGEPVVGDVLRPRRDDPLAPDGATADLVVSVRAPVDALEHPSTGVIGPFGFPRSGSHTPHGFLVLAGSGISPGVLDERPALDLAPTLLDLLGAEAPCALEGTSALTTGGQVLATRS